MRKYLFLYLGLIFILSCVDKKKSTGSTYDRSELTYNMSISNEQLEIQEVIENVDVLKLEFSDECNIGRISKIQFYNNLIYIKDGQNKCIVVFDSLGSCLYKFDNLGEGPGKYASFPDFNIDPSNGNIEILEHNARIHYYNNDGQYIDSKRIDLQNGVATYAKFKRVSSDRTIFFQWGLPVDQLYLYSDSLAMVIGSAVKSLDERGIYGFMLQEIIYSARDTFFYFNSETNTIYNIDDAGLSEYLQLKFVENDFDFATYQRDALVSEITPDDYSKRMHLIYPIFGFSSDLHMIAAYNTSRWQYYVLKNRNGEHASYYTFPDRVGSKYSFLPYLPFVETLDNKKRIRLYGQINDLSPNIQQLKSCMGVDSMEAEILDNFNPEVDNSILFSYNIKEKL